MSTQFNFLTLGNIDSGDTEPLDSDGTLVPRDFTAVFEVKGAGIVEMFIRTEGTRSTVSEVRITEREPGAGVTGLTFSKVSMTKLRDHALRVAALMTSRPETQYFTAMKSADDAGRRRRSVTRDRLRGVIEAHEEGGMDAVMKKEMVGDRQARRLLHTARQELGS